MKSVEPARSAQRCWSCGGLGWLSSGKHICFDCQVEWGGRSMTHNMTDDQMRNHEHKDFYEPGLMLRCSSPG